VRTTKQQARFAGFLYFLLVLSAPLGLLYAPEKLMVEGNAAATAGKLRASEALLRWGIASELLHQVIVVFVVLALYRLFESVSKTLAVQIVILGALLSVPIVFLNALNNVAALMVVNGAEVFSAFTQPQLDALAYLFLRLHARGVTIASIFWGLWLFPFGLAVIRSGFIPRILGYLLLLAGAGYVAEAFVTLIVPQFGPVVSPTAKLLVIAEVPIIFWLLIWGARTPPVAGSDAAGSPA
jgi:hypothetical protein